MKIRLKDALWALRENKRAKVWLMIGVVGFLVLVLVGVILFVNRNSEAKEAGQQTVNIDLAETVAVEGPLPRFIDGVTVEPGRENLLPIGVMIENLVTIRPQAGLQAANVVYEALAEGGITRFLALYASEENLSEIGPVRSARHYFVDWAEEYEGVYVHAGGSPQALGQLASSNTFQLTLNQVGGDHAYFWRDPSISAPHNLFTSTELLQFALRDNALLEKSGTFTPWKFGAEAELENRPTDPKTIRIPFSSASYDSEYTYDRESNSYRRSNGGVEHTDRLTGEQITVRNVVVQYAETSLLEAASGRLDIVTAGEGQAVVFANGQVTEATWRKDAGTERTRFYGPDGSEVKFVPGNIWIHLLPTDRTVEYN